MGGLVDYDYDFFDEYQSDVLADLPSIEQLIRLDDEVANKVTMPRYEGPVDPIEWTFLENYYSGLFADFITDRIQGLVDTEPIEANRDRFHGFREDIVSVNQNLPAQRAARSGVISKPAETVLLKRLRQLGFDPSALDVSHIGSGGGLYLLELFVTAAQQEALSDTALLTALLDEADSLGSMSKEAAMSRLHRPVLMVSCGINRRRDSTNGWTTVDTGYRDGDRHGENCRWDRRHRRMLRRPSGRPRPRAANRRRENHDRRPFERDPQAMGAGDTGEARAPNACWTDG